MADRNRKVQLGARVTGRAREVAVAAAAEAKESLNEWIEKAIFALAGDIGAAPVVPHPDQIPLIADPEMQPGIVEIREDETTVGRIVNVGTADGPAPYDARPDVDVKAFDPACRNRAYHWKQGPGSPCRFCGGEA